MGDNSNPLGARPAEVPITTASEDTLERAPLARSFADSIQSSNSKYGLVVGVMAPWGHGKSSFINLMRERFEEEPGLTVIDFNPWMFSGTSQLVQFFLNQLAAELKLKDDLKYSKIASQITEYAGVLKPTLELFGGALGKLFVDTAEKSLQVYIDKKQEDTSANELRDKITTELANLDNPIVVVIDDIDRLSSLEIREIFQLVRLTASFPNVIYLLAFDRNRVELALSDDSISGRAFLEKIVQVSYDVPETPEQLLTPQIVEVFNALTESSPKVEIDEGRWGMVFWDVIRPLFSNIRDLIRFKMSAEPTIRELGSQIDLVDLFTIEAIRIFGPETFSRIAKNRKALTQVTSSFDKQDQDFKHAVNALLTAGVEDGIQMGALIHHIFPAATKYISNTHYSDPSQAQWRTSHRIAHLDFLSAYLDRVAPSELVSFRSAEYAFEYLDSGPALQTYLNSLKSSELTEIIGNIASFEAKFTREMIVPTSSILLNTIDKMSEQPSSGLLTSGRPEVIVASVLVRLMKVIEDQNEKVHLATEILNRTETFSSMLYYINVIGDHENIGRNLIAPEESARLRERFVDLVEKVESPYPDREWDAWRVYYEVQRRDGGFILLPSDDPLLLRSVLRSVSTNLRRETSDSYQIKIEKRLHWDLLTRVFGYESSIAKVVQVLREEYGDDELTQLASKYLSGWKPDPF